MNKLLNVVMTEKKKKTQPLLFSLKYFEVSLGITYIMLNWHIISFEYDITSGLFLITPKLICLTGKPRE